MAERHTRVEILVDYDGATPLSTLEEMLDRPDGDDSKGMTDRDARVALERCVYYHDAPATRWLGYVRELSQIPHIFRLVTRWLEWGDPSIIHRVLTDRYTNAYELLRIFETSYLCESETGALLILALENLLHAGCMKNSRIPLKLLDLPSTGSSICLFHMPQTREESAILDLIVRDAANAANNYDVYIFRVNIDHKVLSITKQRRATKAN